MMRMMKKALSLLLCVLLASGPVWIFAEGGTILDGRWLCADIKGNVTGDTPAELKDDFGLFVNKDWILQAEIPSGESKTGMIEDVSRILKDRQIALMKDTSLTGHDAELVQKFYRLVSDWDYRNTLGVAPAMPIMEAFRSIDSLEALTAFLCDRNNNGRYYPLTMVVDTDLLNPNIYITMIDTPELMLQDSAEYTQRTQAGELYYAKCQQVGTYMLTRLGFSEDEAAQVFGNAYAFEALMAQHIKPQAARYREDYYASILNHYTPDELQVLAGDFPILKMIEAYGLKIGKNYLVPEPDYVAALQDLYIEENVPLMRDWLTLKEANDLAKLLDQETYQQTQAISNTIMGITGETSEDDYALDTVLDYLVVPMDNLYIQAYCTEQQRQDMLDIIGDSLRIYRRILESADWLGDETRAKAIEKLDTMRVFAVYPDQLGDWSGLDFSGADEGGSLLTAEAAVNEFRLTLQSKQIDTSVDMDEWNQLITPTAQVNASYGFNNNSINILAGFLCGGIYDENMSYEQKLGGIGTVIGHEISHAFDNEGSQFDKDGALSNWWTDEDRAAFQARAAKLAAWFNGFIPWEGAKYSGQQVQGEAIADLGSMKCMLAIAAQQENFNYDAFFRHYAALWRTQALPAYIITKVAEDVHPMRYQRINATLAQFDEFIDYYHIQPGDGMYIAPEDRVSVW